MAVLEVQNLTAAVEDRVLFRDLSFSLAAGSLTAVVAPSGAGKTTLLRAIAGLHPREGTVVLAGERLEGPTFRRRAVYVAQTPAMIDGSVLDNLARPFQYRCTDRSFDPARADTLMRQLGMDGRNDDEARRLSGGEQQRVSLVRALLLEPPVLLLDEPTAALDEDNVEQVEGLLRRYLADGERAILMVTHDASQIDRLADDEVRL